MLVLVKSPNSLSRIDDAVIIVELYRESDVLIYGEKIDVSKLN